MKNVLLIAVMALLASMPMTSQAQSFNLTDQELLESVVEKTWGLSSFLYYRGERLSRPQLE